MSKQKLMPLLFPEDFISWKNSIPDCDLTVTQVYQISGIKLRVTVSCNVNCPHDRNHQEANQCHLPLPAGQPNR
jgi:hypothetical protein